MFTKYQLLRRYRVSTANCVLNYFQTKGQCEEYLDSLYYNSKDVWKECVIEIRRVNSDDRNGPSAWDELSPLCYRGYQTGNNNEGNS